MLKFEGWMHTTTCSICRICISYIPVCCITCEQIVCYSIIIISLRISLSDHHIFPSGNFKRYIQGVVLCPWSYSKIINIESVEIICSATLIKIRLGCAWLVHTDSIIRLACSRRYCQHIIDQRSCSCVIHTSGYSLISVNVKILRCIPSIDTTLRLSLDSSLYICRKKHLLRST